MRGIVAGGTTADTADTAADTAAPSAAVAASVAAAAISTASCSGSAEVGGWEGKISLPVICLHLALHVERGGRSELRGCNVLCFTCCQNYEI